jgi:nitrile hydratase subunit beta
MNGIHDIGGMHGFGHIMVEENEPVYHAEWEKGVQSMMAVMLSSGHFAVDQLRRNIERQDAVTYLSNSYYENWLHSLQQMVLNAGFVTADELANGHIDPASSAGNTGRATQWRPVPDLPAGPPAYGVNDRVRAKVRHPVEHTREPRYVRGRVGVVTHYYGGEPLPELAGEGVRQDVHLYRVRFEATELWGPDAHPNDALYIDLCENYLEPA